MSFCNGVDQPLITPVLFQTLFDFGVRSAGALEIAFVYHHGISKIEHYDFLQLQSAAVVGVHHQNSRIDNAIFLKRHRLLAGADGFYDYVIEPRPSEQRQTIVRGGRKPASLSTCGHAAHEYAIILRIDHRGPIAQQRSLANYARITMINSQNDRVFMRSMATR